ncbi:aminotransferase class V-fold PLP-dependent enzyme, partial [Staphylococcus aureus]|uniref:aminotransferase class V-fold PLP-dependent enzyme n=1 Tax=Staphylococcus aureus TaxID=1280 RepID=UPI001C82ED7E
LRVIPVDDTGQIILEELPKLINERTKLLSITQVSNALGTVTPVAEVIKIAHAKGVRVLVDWCSICFAARATDAYEHARNVVARFIGAPSSKEIIFVRGTTEGINLIAKTWGEQNIGEGDEIIVSHLEHHANIVPWYQLTKKTGAKFTSHSC